MRFIMFLLAVGVAFVAWDAIENNGRYVNLIARDLKGSMQFAGGGGVVVIRPPDLSPTWKKFRN